MLCHELISFSQVSILVMSSVYILESPEQNVYLFTCIHVLSIFSLIGVSVFISRRLCGYFSSHENEAWPIQGET